MNRIRFTATAEIHVREIVHWWAEHRSTEQALRWARGLQTEIGNIAKPRVAHRLARESSRLTFELYEKLYGVGRRKTHRVLYRILPEEQVIEVIAVRHLAMDDYLPED